jgi:Flp pilus assembly protein TadG
VASRALRRLREEEDGNGVFSAVSGFLAFLAFLLMATQLLIHLYATSVVTAAAHDAARIASGSTGTAGAAQAHAMSVLGGLGASVQSLTVSDGGDHVVVRVQARSPALLPRQFGDLTGISSIDREIIMRKEDLVGAP